MRLLLVLLIGVLLAPLPAAAGDVAVVVHPSNPESDVSMLELARIFRLDRQHWKEGGRIYLILRESGAPSKDVVLHRIYRMDDAGLKRFWLGKLYRGEIASFPRVVSSNALVKQIVSQAPNAIGFIDVAEVDDTVKVLRIGGVYPGGREYLLASTENED